VDTDTDTDVETDVDVDGLSHGNEQDDKFEVGLANWFVVRLNCAREICC
jgi:hypothetical protein